MMLPLNVLILEDRDHDARLLVHQLQQAGYEPQWQRVDTEAAYLAALTPSIDVVFADHHVPGWDPMKALAVLHARDWDIPFIIVSGTIGEEAAVAAMRQGATDYLLKDRMTRLGVAVQQALDTRRLRNERRTMAAELRASEGRFLALSEAAVEAVGFHERGLLVDVNTAFERLFGFSRADLMGRPILDLFAAASRDLVRQLILDGRASSYEAEGLRKDGTTFHADVTSRVITHDGRSVRVAVIRDITERYRAALALREGEARFREFAANVHDVFYTVEVPTGRVLYASPGYERASGRSVESLYANADSLRDNILPEDRAIFDTAVSRRRAGGITDIEYRIVRADGQIRWIRDHAYPVRGTTGTIERVVGTARDITGYKYDGDRLREQASLLDKARDAIVVRDLGGRITYWNSSAERLYGWAAAEVVGQVVDESLYRDPSAYRRASEQVLLTGEWVGELQLRNRHGKDVVTESRWTLVSSDTGQPHSILAINTDVTEKKALEQQFLRAQRLESIGTLASGIAHDLNNVLTPILMAVEMLKETAADETSAMLLSTAESSAKRGAALVAQVLSFARGSGDRREDVRVVDVIADLERIAHDTFPKNIQILTSVSRDLWPVVGDPTQIHQVLLNLCVNARDAMPAGGLLTITADNIDSDARHTATEIDAKAGPYVVLQVADTGTGMPADVVDKIFDPFFTTKEIGKGTGLGLSTARTIVASHGGSIRVHSEPGTGTKFRIYLPAHTGQTPQEAANWTADLPRGHGETVLLVDDEASIRQIAQHTLEAFGYTVMPAENGAAGVALYSGHLADIAVVLVDMMMPVMDGAATIAALVKLNPSVRIVATSGVAVSEKPANVTDSRVKAFLPKPYTAAALLTTLHGVLAADP